LFGQHERILEYCFWGEMQKVPGLTVIERKGRGGVRNTPKKKTIRGMDRLREEVRDAAKQEKGGESCTCVGVCTCVCVCVQRERGRGMHAIYNNKSRSARRISDEGN
jgi:hypothetical protein